MWARDRSYPPAGFFTPPPPRKSGPPNPPPMSERKRVSPAAARSDLFHVAHKVPAGDSPYVRAKQVQLIDKNPSKAISLFWAAINAGDRVDSALKDMAVVMKQLDRAEEAIEAIKSFRHLCPYESQESLNNVLVELYKRAGRIEDEIETLQSKLKRMDEGIAFNGKRTKTARAQGKKVQITVEQERSRVLGNLAWAYMQQGNYTTAEEHYKNALALEPDKNKQCNLAICLMHMNRITEARHLLQAVRDSAGNKPMDESYAKSFERSFEMLTELEQQSVLRPIQQNENYCTGISRTPKPSGSGYMPMPPRRWTDGPEYVTVANERHRESFRPGSCAKSFDKWKKDYDLKNTGDSRPSFSSSVKQNQDGMTVTEVNPHEKTYVSPVLYTQPRRPSWGFNDGHQRSEIWGNGVGSSNKKLPPERSAGNVRAHVVRNLNADLLASTPRESDSSLSSRSHGDWRMPQRDAVARPVLQPVSSMTSRGNEGYLPVRNEAMIDRSSKYTGNGDIRRVTWDNAGMQKSAAGSQVVDENAKALLLCIDEGDSQSSGTTVLGSMENMNASVEEDCLGDNSSGTLDNVHQSPAENERPTLHQSPAETEKPTPDFWKYSGKKSWADMVEEEEEELRSGTTGYFDSWNTGDEFDDENRNPNIMTPQSPQFQTQMKRRNRLQSFQDITN
ncbi:PREDICTED: uncharacterized protein LOC101293965 [Fragaria vesca subsp. vesca]|uniref:uncharacterized protein LOC101293965 n=1 Tax=Fragaria vesca subsp. vesca TaxID=101020 RepID=UPI0002C33109|nr:PREDICTED: uncharacterized protein LOC101293965 [Fragaria vesca subsp. vesca]